MFPVRYIHAADLHLDAAFRGISREASTADLAAHLRAATFTALDRLFALCEKEKPDFLVIAGDIYNEEDHSLKAQLALRDGCERLAACGVRVFLAHGNHDPLSSRLQTLCWPDNTVIFSDTVQSHIVRRGDKAVAVVHGISHATNHEARNLASAFTRLDKGEDSLRRCFQLGVLHCTVDGAKHADRYAPCSLRDLEESRLDAWALGHVHERRELSHNPFVAYPGNIQGLHIHETGSRGCLLVSATPQQQEQGFDCTATFHALGPVVWETLSIDVEGAEVLDTVEQRIMEAVERAAAHCDVGCQILMLRASLSGRTPLDATLRSPEVCAELAERIRDTASGRPLPWLKDIVVETGQWLEMDELLQREDLLGETLRMARDCRNNDETLAALAKTSLTPLFGHGKARKILAAPDGQDLHMLLDEAQRLCVDLMESR